MTTKRFDPIEELRPLQAGAVNDYAVEVSRDVETPLAYDVYRVADELCIDFDVPGVDPAAIRLALENQFLTVSVSREINEAGVEVIERGRVHGSFERRLVLPGHWQLDELRASCANGVLQVRAPLRSPRATRTIAVETPTTVAFIGDDVATVLDGASDAFVADHERIGSAA